MSAGKLYEVNERGPELLNVGSRTMLMMGSQGGSVTPNSELGGGGLTQNISIDARGADAGVEQRIRRAMNEATMNAVALVQQKANRGGSFAKSLGRA